MNVNREQAQEFFARFLESERERELKKNGDTRVLAEIFKQRSIESVARYQRDREELLPQAKDGLNNVVSPWAEDLVDSGLYDRVYGWLLQRYGAVTLSKRVEFPGYTEVPKDETLDYLAQLELRGSGGDLNLAKEQILARGRSSQGYTWEARLRIAGEGGVYKPGLGISSSPKGGGGRGFKPHQISLFPDREEGLLERVHPRVWIGLADQIESGKIWEVFKESISKVG